MEEKNSFFPKLTLQNTALSIQHLFAMFGATVLVPLLTGLNTSTALLCAGLGTLLFHLLTKRKVPVFLGSSFAFIPGISAVIAAQATQAQGVRMAQGGILVAGLLYVIFAVIVYFVGSDKIKKIFPPVVTGPVIVVIGLGLSYDAINKTGVLNAAQPLNAGGLDWIIALFVLIVVVAMSIFAKGFFKLVPILIGIAAGYLLCVILHLCGVYTMNFEAIAAAPWFNIPFSTPDANGVPFCTLPIFDWGAILTIAPVALVTFMEHIGDITASSAVVGKDFFTDPGLHRTLLGDGLATSLAGLLGGPSNTTYSENTGVLATTKNYNPSLLRLTAIFAILLAFVGKFGAVLQSIPSPVMGGVAVVLFGMIASTGIRTIVEGKVDLSKSRNQLIIGLVMVVGLGVAIATYLPEALTNTGIQLGNFSLSGLFLSVIIGVIANLVLPKEV